MLQKRIAEAEAAAVRLFRRAGKLASLIKTLPKSVPDGFFFMGAPLAIVCASSNETDAALAAAYMELCAESLGLGGFYCGYFCAAARLSGELRDIISLPDGLKPAVTLVLGHPDVKYLRRAPRRPACCRTARGVFGQNHQKYGEGGGRTQRVTPPIWAFFA